MSNGKAEEGPNGLWDTDCMGNCVRQKKVACGGALTWDMFYDAPCIFTNVENQRIQHLKWEAAYVSLLDVHGLYT